MRPTFRAETVATRLEVRLEDRLEHQQQGCLGNPVSCGGGNQSPGLASFLRYELLPHGQRREPLGLEIISQPGQQMLAEYDGARLHPIHTSSSCPPVPLHPLPGHNQESGIVDQVEQVHKSTVRVVESPLVQLGLHLLYPPPRLIRGRPRRAGVHQRPPDIAIPALRSCCPPSPCARLSRARTTTRTPPHPRANSRRWTCPTPPWLGGGEGSPEMVPTFTMSRSAD